MRASAQNKILSFVIISVTLLAVFSILILKPVESGLDQQISFALKGAVFNKKYQNVANKELGSFAENVDAKQGLVVILDAQKGSMEAVSGYDATGNNSLALVNKPYEPGSIMKPLTLAAALNENRIKVSDRYFNPGFITVDHHVITNVQETGYSELTVGDIIKLSLNTGAVSLLESMSDQKKIDNQSRGTWHKYLADNYQFGKTEGLNLPGEAAGSVPSLQPRVDRDYVFAGSTFGFGVTATPVQLVSAYAAVVNGGTYYKPYFRGLPGEQTQPQVIRRDVVSKEVSQQIKAVLAKTFSFQSGRPAVVNGGSVGAKSGTAPSIMPDGNYNPSRDVGSYIGFFEKDGSQYVMLVKLNEPRNNKLASKHAGELWYKLVSQLL